MKLDLDEIEARANAATGGVWVSMKGPYNETERYVRPVYDGVPGRFVLAAFWENPEQSINALGNSEFVAHARTDIPALIARVRELEDRMERAIECLEDTKSRWQNLDIAAMHILKDGLT